MEIKIEKKESPHNALCPVCGKGEAVRKVEYDHSSADGLGRPMGAKGKDTGATWMECDQCGHMTELYHWPKRQCWVATVEDSYGNPMASAESFSKDDAISEARRLYDEEEDEAFL